MSIEDIARSIVITTDDTYDTYLSHIEDRSKVFIDRINDKLNKPFDVLMDLYIRPVIQIDRETYFRYSNKDYKNADIVVEENWTVLTESETQYRATEIWIERKEKEHQGEYITRRYANWI